ncbi:MAG TPA: PKD domain-containing protein, partial [bacterium]
MKKYILIKLVIIVLINLISISQAVQSQTLSGRVYEGTTGTEPPASKPIFGVTVKLYGSNEANEIGTFVISTTTTDSAGWYGLPVRGAFDFYNIVEENPAGYNSDGATSVSGTVKSADWIQYTYDKLSQTTTGNKFWDKKSGQLNNPPVADADGPYTGTVNQPVQFDGSGSYDPDAGDSITSYEWDMDNDGQFDDATGVYPTWTWNSPTTHSIHLKVTDTHGASGTDSTYVRIEAAVEYDYGDAPDPSYPTLKASNGARHQIDPDVFLGNKIDADADGQQNADASGDDNDGNDDEDGIVFKGAFTPGASTPFEATVSVNGYLGVWVDFNGNGSWTDPGESLFQNDTSVFKGVNNWSIFVPANAKPG